MEALRLRGLAAVVAAAAWTFVCMCVFEIQGIGNRGRENTYSENGEREKERERERERECVRKKERECV